MNLRRWRNFQKRLDYNTTILKQTLLVTSIKRNFVNVNCCKNDATQSTLLKQLQALPKHIIVRCPAVWTSVSTAASEAASAAAGEGGRWHGWDEVTSIGQRLSHATSAGAADRLTTVDETTDRWPWPPRPRSVSFRLSNAAGLATFIKAIAFDCVVNILARCA